MVLKMRKMKDSGIEWIGEIPEGWEIKRLGAILQDRNEVNNPIQTTIILSLTNNRGVIPYSEKGNQGNKAKDDLTGYKIAHIGDIVLNSMNVIIGSVGLSNYYGAVSPVYYMLFPRNNIETNIQYYNYLFQTTAFQQSLRGYGNGILEIRMRIQMQKLKTVLLPVPTFLEQSNITVYLDASLSKLNILLSKTRSSIEEYKKLKQAVITQAVTKGVRGKRETKDSKIEWLGQIPKEWKCQKLKYTIFPQNRPVFNTDEIITCFRDGIVTLRKNRREDGFTVSFTEHGYQGVEIGDLVIHGMDAFAGAIGCSDSRGKTTPVVHVCTTTGNNRFFMFFLRYMAYSNIFMDFSNGIRIRSSDFRNFTKLGIFDVLVPPIAEQNEIADYLDAKCAEIDGLIAKKEQLVKELESYKKSLIYEIVTGKREV